MNEVDTKMRQKYRIFFRIEYWQQHELIVAGNECYNIAVDDTSTINHFDFRSVDS